MSGFFFFLFGGGGGGKDSLSGHLGRRLGDSLLDHLLSDHGFPLGFGKAFAETLHTAGGVDQFLLPREERMARGAHVHFN